MLQTFFKETCFTLIVLQVLQKMCIFLIDDNFLLGLEGNSWSIVKKTPVERSFQTEESDNCVSGQR